MDSGEKEIFRKYAWDYFEYHADQRMKTFNFFIVMAGLLAGGITSCSKMAAILGGLHLWACFFSSSRSFFGSLISETEFWFAMVKPR